MGRQHPGGRSGVHLRREIQALPSRAKTNISPLRFFPFCASLAMAARRVRAGDTRSALSARPIRRMVPSNDPMVAGRARASGRRSVDRPNRCKSLGHVRRGFVTMVIVEGDSNMWHRSGKGRGVKPRCQIRAVRWAWWVGFE
jgi:hypothetical protein